MFFSQRHGMKHIPEIQVEDMNDDLRIGLWNAFYNCFLSSFASPVGQNEAYETQTGLLYNIWLYALKKPGDEFPRDAKKLIAIFKCYFLSEKWHDVFDIVEYAAAKYPREDVSGKFILECNFVLEKEISAYRFVDGVIAPAYADYEQSAVPLTATPPLKGDHTRLQKALSSYATQEKPALMLSAAARMKSREGGTAL